MRITRVWAMPNRWTFEIQPIKEVINRYVGDGLSWIDPFCGKSKHAEFRNDINHEAPALGHTTAEQFALKLEGKKYNGILFDPPYSNRQAKECYKLAGMTFSKEDAQAMWQNEKKLFAPLVEIGGLAICFGWNSNGFGKTNGFELIEILMVAHGARHNDTIVTVERKIL